LKDLFWYQIAFKGAFYYCFGGVVECYEAKNVVGLQSFVEHPNGFSGQADAAFAFSLMDFWAVVQR